MSHEAMRAWLRDELGLHEYRRVVRQSESAIVISKFEAGFSQDLFAMVERLPELFDDGIVAAEYRRHAGRYLDAGEAPLRTQVWREAVESLLNRLSDERGIDAHGRMLILPGIESVQAVLDTILWSSPTAAQDYEPASGEIQAYAEFDRASAEPEPKIAGRDLFTRYYGTMDGRRVENYCPGAQFGRRLVAQAWRICTTQGT